jgi:hypothetical protein
MNIKRQKTETRKCFLQIGASSQDTCLNLEAAYSSTSWYTKLPSWRCRVLQYFKLTKLPSWRCRVLQYFELESSNHLQVIRKKFRTKFCQEEVEVQNNRKRKQPPRTEGTTAHLPPHHGERYRERGRWGDVGWRSSSSRRGWGCSPSTSLSRISTTMAEIGRIRAAMLSLSWISATMAEIGRISKCRSSQPPATWFRI